MPTGALYILLHAGFIRGSRATPRKILLELASLCEHLEKATAPDFWTAERSAKYRDAVPAMASKPV